MRSMCEICTGNHPTSTHLDDIMDEALRGTPQEWTHKDAVEWYRQHAVDIRTGEPRRVHPVAVSTA